MDWGPVGSPLLSMEELPSYFVRGKNRAPGTQFGSHIRDGSPVGHTEVLQGRSAVLDDLPDTSFDGEIAQKMKDHILGADPWWQLAS